MPPLTLNAQRARIFRIVHRENVPWILENGLHSRTSLPKDPGYVAIGKKVSSRGLPLSVDVRPAWYF